ncbi:MAG: hypothetical protein CFH01_00309 [Alphaproteobacteria bacterium MarineAlpha2_Bin1]|nr:MAG: hypothetical protein CFH01_00309 [Alphaproteobacteria bacterium MarineAlpha2_Bin1]|tara:strand:+ start:683 stop:1063 length:381 start_codon:yes stop_codon:yes gene_type:complete
MNNIKYIIEAIVILVIFGVSSVQAETFTIYCGKPNYYKWNENETKWQKQKNPIYREMTIQINFEQLRSRVKYQGKWYSWAFSTIEKEIVTWKYHQKFGYNFNLSKNELIEKKGELFFKYTNCRSIL